MKNRKKTLFLFLAATVLLAVLFFGWRSLRREKIDLDNLGGGCNITSECGDLVGVNCKAEVDGPYYYVNKYTSEIVEYCGGYCQAPGGKYCRHCPPKEWNCKTY